MVPTNGSYHAPWDHVLDICRTKQFHNGLGKGALVMAAPAPNGRAAPARSSRTPCTTRTDCRCERDRDRTEVEHLLLALRVEVMPFANTNCTGPWKAGAVNGRALKARKDAAHHQE
jgi:hypothetical protein